MKWDDWNQGLGPRYPHEKVVQFTFRNFPASERRGTHSLDLGCGSGVHTVFLAEEGFDVVGIDISPVGVENTRRRLTEKGLTAVLAVQDLAALGLPQDYFRLVVCVGVLDCAGLAATRATIPAVHRAMSRGGRALFIFASERDSRVEGENALQLHGFTRDEVDAAFRAGFSELFVDRYITTYRGGEIEQNDWLVTAVK